MRVFLGLILGSAASLGLGVLAYHLKQHAAGVGNFIPRERLRRIYRLMFCQDRQARRPSLRRHEWDIVSVSCPYELLPEEPPVSERKGGCRTA